MSPVKISAANVSMAVMNARRPAPAAARQGTIVSPAMGARPKSRIPALL
ncbi:MAG: hypothetical protein HFF29_05735 [Oscillospiraceae bacterium]|nr:hypothetical protein [Oscillospiraceae bacterium]